MGTEPPADKKEPPAVEQRVAQTDDQGSRTKGYKGGYKRYGKPKSNNKDTVVSKSKFKGAIDALLRDYYFDTGPTQAHDFKKTHKKIATYTGTKYSAKVMQSLEDTKIHDWTRGMPRKPLESDSKSKNIPVEYMDRYNHKMKTHCKREDKFEVDMQLCYTVIHGQCTDDMLHELKCQQRRMN
jgi:hypothetical protein